MIINVGKVLYPLQWYVNKWKMLLMECTIKKRISLDSSVHFRTI
jgi:hypothetical protein